MRFTRFAFNKSIYIHSEISNTIRKLKVLCHDNCAVIVHRVAFAVEVEEAGGSGNRAAHSQTEQHEQNDNAALGEGFLSRVEADVLKK